MPGFIAPKNPASSIPRVSALSGMCSDTTSALARTASASERALDVRREVAVDDYGSQATTRLNTLRADVRHALADAAEADDAEGHVADPPQLARRQVMPLAGMDVAVIGHDVADRGQRQRQRVCGDFADPVVRRIGDPHAVPGAGVGVDGVETGADAAHDAELGQRRDDRSVIGANCSSIARSPRAAAMTSSSVLHCAVTSSTPAGANIVAFEVEVGKIVVGERTLGMGEPAEGGTRVDRGDAQRYGRREIGQVA